MKNLPLKKKRLSKKPIRIFRSEWKSRANSARTNTMIAALIEEPVAADSEIICDIADNDIISITFFPCDREGIVVPGKEISGTTFAK